MYFLYELNVVLHVLAAALWVGGMGLFAIVVVPVARKNLPPEQARAVLRAAGVRFGVVGTAALGVVILTGIGNLAFRGLVPLLASLSFWRSSFGEVLGVKLLLVSAVIVASALHGRIARASASRGGWLGRATLLLSVAVVIVAVFLVRGLPA